MVILGARARRPIPMAHWFVLMPSVFRARIGKLLPLLVLACALLPTLGRAGTFVAFGPAVYQRGTGSPVTVQSAFAILNPFTSYTLQIYNGGLQDGDFEKVSSSVITVNGQSVIGPDEFNQQVSYLDKSLTLAASNTISVEVRGKPGGALVLQIVGVDNDLPIISGSASPGPNAAGWNNTNVTVSFACSDLTSGIASCTSPITVTTEGAAQPILGTATDRAGNSATTTVPVSLDKTAPTIQPSLSPTPNAAGWNNSDVTVSFDCADSLSGIASCTAPVTAGASQTVNGTATDRAGNSATASALVQVDKTPPTIHASATPAPNAAGWHNGDVTVSFICDDAGSGIASCPAPVTVSAEGASQTVNGTATDRAGNSATVSASVQVDKTPPTITASASPAANAGGWHSGDVTVSFTCDDTGSGVADCPAPITVSAEGANQPVSGTATDIAGNSASTSVTVNIDNSAPTITASVAPAPNADGWSNADVTVTFTCDDSGSGIADCSAPVTVSTEGANQEVGGTATNKAGNSATKSVKVNIDKTPPTIHASLSSAAHAGGWNNGDVTVTFTCDDAGSGIASCPDAVTVSAEGANQSISGTATDKAGNTSSTSVTVSIDKTPPSITASVSPTPDATGWNGSDVTVTFTCDDSGSGIVSCPSPVTVSTEGADQPISGTATDNAGNTSSTSVSVSLDKTSPTIAAVRTSSPNAAGWYNGDVTVSFTCNDVLSGVATCTDPVTVSTEGANQAISGTAMDKAGNTATAGATVSIDRTPPTITASVSPTANAAGWHKGDVTVSFTCADTGSGVADCPAPITVSAEGVTQAVSGTATDNAGNTATAGATVSIDKTPPVITLTAPADGASVTTDTIEVSGSVSDANAITEILVNGAAVTAGTSFSTAIALNLGPNTITVVATDIAGNQGSATRTITRLAPLSLSITTPTDGTHVTTETIGVMGTVSDPSAGVVVNGIAATLQGNDFAASSVLLQLGSNTITATATRGADTATAQVSVVRDQAGIPGIPPDPSTVAPPVDQTVATTLGDATAFLYTGSDPIQTGIAPGTIDPVRTAVLRGRVLDRDGAPLYGATISILGHPEFGQTLSREDGMFDLAVNGGGVVTVKYEKGGYLSLQRQVDVPWQDYEPLPDVIMTALDPQVTPIDLGAVAPAQVAQGSVVTDEDGTRQATVVFPSGTGATMVLPDGSTQPLSTLNVRATEYTVGPDGLKAMPGELPPTSGYTYAVELSVDEALAAGAKEVRFSRLVVHYVQNFLNFPIGGIVPVGFYDRGKAAWLPMDNGRVIKILSVVGGLANLDIDGSGTPASAAALAALGVTNEERAKLAVLYQPGQSLWRVPLSHFSPFDCNWPVGFPTGAQIPGQRQAAVKGSLSCPARKPGSIIECENQTLGEQLDVTGTPFSLQYLSHRVPGRLAARTIEIPLSSASTPSPLKRIDLEIFVAGRKFTQPFPASPNQTYHFTWDGKDAYGRTVQGAQPATTRVGYVYNAVYMTPAQRAQSFAATSNAPISGSQARGELTLWQQQKLTVGAWDARAQGLGGWTLDVHHAYDPVGEILYLGDGTQRSAADVSKVITTVAGTGGAGFNGDGGPASKALLNFPYGVTVDREGNLFIADTHNARIRKVDRNGIITTVAGTGVSGFSGDGGPATSARLFKPTATAFDDQGNMYIADWYNHRLRKVDPAGNITTVAGGGTSLADGVPATSASFSFLGGVVVDKQGNIYVSDEHHNTVRRIDRSGMITTVAGGGSSPADGVPATAGALNAPFGLALDGEGNLYIADYLGQAVRKVTQDGIIHRVAGTGTAGFNGEAGDARSMQLNDPINVFVDDGNNLYIGDEFNNRVRKVTPDGYMTTVAGGGSSLGDNGPATRANLNSPLAVPMDALGNQYVVDWENQRIRKVSPTFPSFSNDDLVIASESGSELYLFDKSGRHLSTLNALTGVPIYLFSYDPNGLLTEVHDANGNVTRIERNSGGTPLAIVSPDGQRTTLGLDANGFLSRVRNPAGEATQFGYTADGLLTGMADPKGNTHVFQHDALGRLLHDEDPAGGSWALSRTATGATDDVLMTSALGRTTNYHVEPLLTGGTHRVVTDPSGVVSLLDVTTDDRSTSTAPDGTVTTSVRGPDPRFGMMAPSTGTVTTTTPSGKKTTIASTRAATLANPADLLSLTSQTDTVVVNGRTYTSTFNSTARTMTRTTPAGRQTSSTVDDQLRVLQARVPGLTPVNFGYDARGRLTGIGQGTRASSMSYDAHGNLASITDPMSRTVGFAYDDAGRVRTQTLPDGRLVQYTYDPSGNVTSITPPGRPAHGFGYTPVDLEEDYVPPNVGAGTNSTHYTYNLDKQLTQIARPDGQTVNLGYDAGGRLSTVTSPRGTVGYAYDATKGTLTSITSPDGATLTYAYDGFLPTSETSSGNVSGSLSWTYDNDFRTTSESVNGGSSVSFTYDADSLLTAAGALTLTRNPQNGLLTSTALGSSATSQSYNSFGEIAQVTATQGASTALGIQYLRDDLGRIIQKTETVGGLTDTYAYGYDGAGRLTLVGKNGTTTASYAYDANGNRLSRTTPSTTETGTYDNQDRLLTYGTKTYTYTANGELSTKTDTATSQTTQYAYDTLGNLNTALLPDGRRIDYLVDGRNRRVAKKVNGAFTKKFVYGDQLRIAAELSATNTLVSRFVYATRVNVPDYLVRGSSTYRVVTDHLGSPRLVIDVSTGTIAQRIDYDEFGRVTLDTNPGFQPFGFAGGLYDPDTGLVRFGARDYDAEAGRWTGKDSILFMGKDNNLYGYVINDPINWIDPEGLDRYRPPGRKYVFGRRGSWIQPGDKVSRTAEDYVFAMSDTANAHDWANRTLRENGVADFIANYPMMIPAYAGACINSNLRDPRPESRFLFPIDQPSGMDGKVILFEFRFK